MKTNTKAIDRRKDRSARLAGGYGVYAAKQDAEALLRRAVLACLLWENLFYESGQSNADNIRQLIPQVPPETVAQIAIEARVEQKLRHVPLFIAREMARLDTHKGLVSKLLPQIILRADELAEFLAIYWKDGRQPLSAQVKKGLAAAFTNFNAYHLAKYNRPGQVKLRDALFLCHARPRNGAQENAFHDLVNDTLTPPDTWEVALSAGTDKAEAFTRLISEGKLGALAFVRNLRLMTEVGVSEQTILHGFNTINPGWLLPLNYLTAADAAPKWKDHLEDLMLRGLAQAPKLRDRTIFVVDVSGSMTWGISDRSKLTRLDAAAAMAVLAREMCEDVVIYITGGNDWTRVHKTERLQDQRGFDLANTIKNSVERLGGGGIFTRQCLNYIREHEQDTPDRIIVFSDSADCDVPSSGLPKPFGRNNYIVDVSSHSHGINYDGIWAAEISGWSEHFLRYIAALEGEQLSGQESE